MKIHRVSEQEAFFLLVKMMTYNQTINFIQLFFLEKTLSLESLERERYIYCIETAKIRFTFFIIFSKYDTVMLIIL